MNGLALGLPLTGANRIQGVAIGVFGLGIDNSITGLGVGGLGLGSGGDLHGIMLGGLGVGTGGSAEGITIGGIGVGTGGRLRGLQVGGIGVGGGQDVSGITIGGIGVGSGGRLSGLAIGGIGIGGGGDFTGIGVGGIGIGVGGDATGIMIGGLGVGAGGRLKGLTIGGVGVGAPAISGVVLTPIAAGTLNAHALVVSGLYFKIEEAGRFDGGSISSREQHPGRAARPDDRIDQLRARAPRPADRTAQHLRQRRPPPRHSDRQQALSALVRSAPAPRRAAHLVEERQHAQQHLVETGEHFVLRHGARRRGAACDRT